MISAVWLCGGILLEIFFLLCAALSVWTAGLLHYGTLMAFILAAVWGMLLFLRRPLGKWTKKGFGRFCKIVFFLCWAFYFGVVFFVSVSGYRDTVTYREKAVVVLGAGIDGEEPGPLLQKRLDTAIAYHEKNPDALLVLSGGKASEKELSEAEVMQRYLLKKGVPQSVIIREDCSASTEENLAFSRMVLEKYGIGEQEPVVCITNAFHSYRAQRYALQAGFTEMHSLHAPMAPAAIPACYLREALTVLHLWFLE